MPANIPVSSRVSHNGPFSISRNSEWYPVSSAVSDNVQISISRQPADVLVSSSISRKPANISVSSGVSPNVPFSFLEYRPRCGLTQSFTQCPIQVARLTVSHQGFHPMSHSGFQLDGYLSRISHNVPFHPVEISWWSGLLEIFGNRVVGLGVWVWYYGTVLIKQSVVVWQVDERS